MIISEQEKKRILKLHEATTASASGSYNQPMGFSVPGLGGEVQTIDLETTFIDGDNIVGDSTEITLNLDDIFPMTEEGDKKRMRKLHKENSTIKEQTDTIPSDTTDFDDWEPELKEVLGLSEECVTCIETALGPYKDKADIIIGKLEEIYQLEELPSEKEMIEIITTILGQLGGINIFSIGAIALSLYNCSEQCVPKPDGTMEVTSGGLK